MTQTERLFEWLKSNPIDPLTAWSELGIYRLSARINDLKNRGHIIHSKKKTLANRFGEKVTVAKYWMEK
jgi:hypothetical protein